MNAAYDYLRDPAAIYAASFETIRRECDLSAVPADLHDLALRIVHACGQTDVLERLAWAPGAGAVARGALAAGATLLVDTEMLAHGIQRSRLSAGNPLRCLLNAEGVAEHALQSGTTRSAAAVDFWEPWIAGSVVVIGNAPTALFRLLELLAEGWPRPAVILGFPVGFVGAEESKEALIADSAGVPFVTLRGRQGGSAIAAAAVNALAGGQA